MWADESDIFTVDYLSASNGGQASLVVASYGETQAGIVVKMTREGCSELELDSNKEPGVMVGSQPK